MDTEPPMASTSDYFNRIIGLIEDVVIAEDFQALQHSFMEKYYEHFDSTTDENRLEYMEIFAEYTGTMETHIVTELQKQMADAFDMERFAVELGAFKDQLDGEIFELLYSLSDFVTFKEMMMDYKLFKSGDYVDMSAGIVVKRLSSDDDLDIGMALGEVDEM